MTRTGISLSWSFFAYNHNNMVLFLMDYGRSKKIDTNRAIYFSALAACGDSQKEKWRIPGTPRTPAKGCCPLHSRFWGEGNSPIGTNTLLDETTQIRYHQFQEEM